MLGFKYLNFYGIATLIFIIYIFYKYCKKKLKTFQETKETSFNIDKTEYEPLIDYNLLKAEEYTYLFWSGGFSSTFRLCQLLLIEEKPVQTIYLNINNNNNLKREMELRSIKNIRNTIIKDYPILKPRFPPTLYVNRIKKDTDITNKFKYLHREYGYFNNIDVEYDIYENIARFSYHYKFPIELTIDNDEYNMNQALSRYLEDYNLVKHKKLKENIPVKYNYLHIFDKCLFPISYLTKNQLKQYSINNNYFYILNNTWSCENPTNDKMICSSCSKCIKNNLPIFIPQRSV